MQNRLTWFTTAAIIVLILVVASLWFLLRHTEEAPLVSSVQVVLGCERSLLNAPVWIALDQGFFQPSGVNQNIRR